MVSKWLIHRVYCGYNPLTNHFQTSWDIQVGHMGAGPPGPIVTVQPLGWIQGTSNPKDHGHLGFHLWWCGTSCLCHRLETRVIGTWICSILKGIFAGEIETKPVSVKIGGILVGWLKRTGGGGNSYHEEIDRFKKHLLPKHLDARNPVYLHGFMHLCMVVQDVFLVGPIMFSIMMQSVEWKVTRASTAAKMWLPGDSKWPLHKCPSKGLSDLPWRDKKATLNFESPGEDCQKWMIDRCTLRSNRLPVAGDS